MSQIQYISFVHLIVFLIAYFLKLIMLYKNSKIKANVLGKVGKDKNTHFSEMFVKVSSFTGIFIWLMETIFSDRLAKYTGWFYLSRGYTYTGLFFMFLGVLFFILAAGFMKSSWRVGIDKQTKTKLVTDGIYKFSRNPAFVGFDLIFMGLCITFPCILTLIAMFSNLIAFHLLILQEEKHLAETFGDEYNEYKHNTPRYILFNFEG